jgi:hypothetical protein
MALLASACAPELGDGCVDALECAVDGTRVCDTTQPGGYCLIPGCRADECPDEGVCVRFGLDERARTFCLRHCNSDGDCRNGYDCVQPGDDDDPSTEIVDESPEGSGFCSPEPS